MHIRNRNAIVRPKSPSRAFVSLLLLILFGFPKHSPAESLRELIFQPGSTSFASSHASTLIELKDGSIMAAWFGGTAEGKPDVAIWFSRRPANLPTAAWSKPIELAREPNVACWNPVLFYTRDAQRKDDRLWLYYKFGTGPQSWTASRKYSDDEGKTWSPAEHLPAGLIGPVRAKPLVLPDSTIVSGSSTESYHSWAVWIERSTDKGKTWSKIGPIVPPTDLPRIPGSTGARISAQTPGDADWKQTEGIIQPSVVSLGGKHLRFYARSTEKTARVVVADSYNDGMTWTPAHSIEIPNPNSGIDAVSLKDGRIILIYNNTTTGRTPLNLAISSDAEHFTMFSTLESQPGEYSYPSMIQAKNGDLCITYTWDRKSIRYLRIPLSDLPKKP